MIQPWCKHGARHSLFRFIKFVRFWKRGVVSVVSAAKLDWVRVSEQKKGGGVVSVGSSVVFVGSVNLQDVMNFLDK